MCNITKSLSINKISRKIIQYKKSHRPAVAFINIDLLINISPIRLDA